jgi:hypothetical protein
VRARKFPKEPEPEAELVTLRRELRQTKTALRERDQQLIFMVEAVRQEKVAVQGMREVQQTMCRTVLAVRDRFYTPEPKGDLDDPAAKAFDALVDLAETWLDPNDDEEARGNDEAPEHESRP